MTKYGKIANVVYYKEACGYCWLIRKNTADDRIIGLKLVNGKIKDPAAFFKTTEDGIFWVNDQIKHFF